MLTTSFPPLIAHCTMTVALAPATDAMGQIQQVLADPTAAWASANLLLQPFAIDAITAVCLSYDRWGLADAAANLFNSVYEPSGGCPPTSNLLFVPLAIELARPGWTDGLEPRQWQNLTAVGRKGVAGPSLVIAGAMDASPHTTTPSRHPSCPR